MSERTDHPEAADRPAPAAPATPTPEPLSTQAVSGLFGAFGGTPRSSTWGPSEMFAFMALTIGALALPVIGPTLGALLSWLSGRWSRTDKVIANLAVLLTTGVLVVDIYTGGPVRQNATFRSGTVSKLSVFVAFLGSVATGAYLAFRLVQRGRVVRAEEDRREAEAAAAADASGAAGAESEGPRNL